MVMRQSLDKHFNFMQMSNKCDAAPANGNADRNTHDIEIDT